MASEHVLGTSALGDVEERPSIRRERGAARAGVGVLQPWPDIAVRQGDVEPGNHRRRPAVDGDGDDRRQGNQTQDGRNRRYTSLPRTHRQILSGRVRRERDSRLAITQPQRDPSSGTDVEDERDSAYQRAIVPSRARARSLRPVRR